MSNLFPPKLILKFALIFCGIYFLSYLAYLFPILNVIIFWLIVILTTILSLKKLEYGVLIVLSELFLGGRGYLFSFNFFGFVVSLRLALFSLVFLIWLFAYRPLEKYQFTKSKFFLPFACFTVLIILGVARGLYFGHLAKYIFFDVNGYFYFAFAFPLFDVISKNNFSKKILRNLVASGIALSLLTIFMAFSFPILHPEARPEASGILAFEFEEKKEEAKEISHTVFAKEELKSYALRREIPKNHQAEYRWARDTGTGELAFISGKFFRFFSASQIYLLVFLSFLLFSFKDCLIQRNLQKTKIEKIFYLITFALVILAILISFSRSLWLGTFAIFLLFLFSLPKNLSLKIFLYFIGILGIIIIITSTLTPQLYEVLSNRISTIFHPQTQSTAITRLNILKSATSEIAKHPILGWGFGKIITYESVIPGASGILKVFAFEWQYLEIILKLGLLGLIIYLWLLYSIFKMGYLEKNLTAENKFILSALLVGLLGILITNITTPYLNHPLGIGYLLIVMAISYEFRK